MNQTDTQSIHTKADYKLENHMKTEHGGFKCKYCSLHNALQNCFWEAHKVIWAKHNKDIFDKAPEWMKMTAVRHVPDKDEAIPYVSQSFLNSLTLFFNFDTLNPI